MSPEQKRKFNTAFGSLFLVSGIAAWGLSAYYAKTPNEPIPAPIVSVKEVDIRSCANAMRRLGYNSATVRGDELTLHERLSDNPEEQLHRASIAANACKLEMTYFCIGQECERPGITVVIERPKH